LAYLASATLLVWRASIDRGIWHGIHPLSDGVLECVVCGNKAQGSLLIGSDPSHTQNYSTKWCKFRSE
jgi:hypothetical protein